MEEGRVHTTTTAIGRQAERAAGAYLRQCGFAILEYNWRRRDCEIDMVARKGNTLYFVEVKYRATDRAGGGLEYITARKLKQMVYAARWWIGERSWCGEWCLAAVEVSGGEFLVTGFVENLAW